MNIDWSYFAGRRPQAKLGYRDLVIKLDGIGYKLVSNYINVITPVTIEKDGFMVCLTPNDIKNRIRLNKNI